ncbi:MAG: cupin domain-containing protein [Pseudomonadales bacterium]
MKKLIACLTSLALSQAVLAGSAPDAKAVILPAELNKADLAGAVYDRKDVTETTHEDGHVTHDITSLVSSDKKFSSGMYKSGKTRIDVNEPYGVDEFMYFLEGSVTLTSSDGTVQTIEAGEGVTIPKEWTGVWETDGYSKIWVIYSAEESEE